MTPAKVVRSGIAARDRRWGFANSHDGVGDTYQTVPGLFGRAGLGRVMTTHELETYDDCVRDLLDECLHSAPILRAPAATRARLAEAVRRERRGLDRRGTHHRAVYHRRAVIAGYQIWSPP